MYEKYYGCVYETVNKINGMKYIGKLIFARKNDWRKYLGSGLYLKRAIKKYGSENFEKTILFLATDKEELNELEVNVIDIYKACESSDYYNIKKSAIGGDCYTNSPSRDRRRMEHSRKMSGELNPQYKKPKTEKMINSVKKANSKKIIVDDVIYNSITEYANKFNVKHNTAWFRINSIYNDRYFYADENGNKVPKKSCGSGSNKNLA